MSISSPERVLDAVERDLDLIESGLRGWNRQYYTNHRRRYLDDLALVRHWYRSGEILEIGSLPFHLTACLKELGYAVVGVDVDPERGQDFVRKRGLTVLRCDIEREPIPVEDGRFGLVLFCEIFEHLRIDLIATMSEVNRVLAMDGILILTTPNLFSIGNILKFLSGRPVNDVYEEFEKLQTIGHMGHVREYSTREIRRFLEKVGFSTRAINYRGHMARRELLRQQLGDIRGRALSAALTGLETLRPRLRPYQSLVAQKVGLPRTIGETWSPGLGE